jgi:hypothetical protein
VPAEKFLSPRQVWIARFLMGLMMAMITFGIAGALVIHPSWQLWLSLACVVAAIPIALVLPGRMVAPFQPGVPASAYLADVGLVLAFLALFTAGAILFSLAPIS